MGPLSCIRQCVAHFPESLVRKDKRYAGSGDGTYFADEICDLDVAEKHPRNVDEYLWHVVGFESPFFGRTHPELHGEVLSRLHLFHVEW